MKNICNSCFSGIRGRESGVYPYDRVNLQTFRLRKVLIFFCSFALRTKACRFVDLFRMEFNQVVLRRHISGTEIFHDFSFFRYHSTLVEYVKNGEEGATPAEIYESASRALPVKRSRHYFSARTRRARQRARSRARRWESRDGL